MRGLRAWIPLLAFLLLVAIVLGTRPALLKLALLGASRRSEERRPVPGTAPPIDPAEAALGRFLFFDPILSANRARSCASCHSPSLGLSDSRARALAIDSTDLHIVSSVRLDVALAVLLALLGMALAFYLAHAIISRT